jgi:hypothetical protein
MATFDPAAWVAAYEAVGGRVHLMRQHGRYEGLWLGMDLSPDGEGLRAELAHPDGRAERETDLACYIAASRGVQDMPKFG